ncbi:SDR family oxidoreductase [Saccharopolyspora phatthalungensis]|uniref:3-oxoacyl-[acyl-carrier protein] reductase n=1 Tax=Saccharopolyspora phatthalungensis TaxID=664693 RepID=A0A840Q7Y2_9PSEU|nr:SDR family oxidoreductase [Saccharopolyspora phatthalungensis]MBB5156556.1 3-oxoacyl-[acyl-carrier protein] reductase [Saccharopolyspora phatthalungensis]
MSKRFDGRVAIVTGSSRGIGLAIAERLVSEGAKVTLTARKPESLAEAVQGLGGAENALGIAGKADDEEHQAETIAKTVETFGRLDMLVNNAGINPAHGPLIDLDLGIARKTFEVNVLATVAWTQQAYRAWLKEHGGSVLNVSSVAGLRPAPGIGFYGATKAMLAHITKELALELGPDVRVNGIAPAVVKTKFATALYADKEDEIAAGYPLKRLGIPADISGAAAFLLSAEASWITGQILVLDGGVTLRGGV